MKRFAAIRVVLALAGLGVAAFLARGDIHRRDAIARVGRALSPFEVATLNGETQRVPARNGTIVYTVFTTWCEECRAEVAHLRHADPLLRARGVRLIAVDQGEPAPAVAAFVAREHIGYPVLLDASGRSATVLAARMVPTTVIVRDGIVLRILRGAVSASELERWSGPAR